MIRNLILISIALAAILACQDPYTQSRSATIHSDPPGQNGFNGPSGYNGFNGRSGYNGFNGPSGYNGFNGTPQQWQPADQSDNTKNSLYETGIDTSKNLLAQYGPQTLDKGFNKFSNLLSNGFSGSSTGGSGQ